MEIVDEQLADDLLAKLARLAERQRHVEQLLSDPQVIEDTPRLTRLAREHGALSKLVDEYQQLLEVRDRREDARESLELYPEDEELALLAREELEETTREQQRLLQEVIDLLVTDETEANRNVIMEIRPGTGGEEAALFASDLFGMYTRYAEKQGWQVELLNASHTDLGGVREVIFSVSGSGVWQRLRYESGGHRVQRVPETESQGRIHTSLATVAVMPEAEEVEVQIRPDDLDVSFVRSTGPGGQHVNKTSSCVRIVHEPTGITVRCQDEKSQSANRKKAMKVLRARLYEKYQQEQQEERDELRRSQVGTGDRNARVRTYNFPQDRVTDHRIGLDVFGVESFIMGDCDRMFDALADYDRQQRIRAFIKGRKRSAPTGS